MIPQYGVTAPSRSAASMATHVATSYLRREFIGNLCLYHSPCSALCLGCEADEGASGFRMPSYGGSIGMLPGFMHRASLSIQRSSSQALPDIFAPP